MPVVGFSVCGEFHLTDSEGIVALETTPLSSVIRLPLADLFRHQDWVACGLEEQPAQHYVVPDGERVTSGGAFTSVPEDNTDSPVGGLSRIDKLSDRGASDCVGCVPPPQPAGSAATARTAKTRNASFLTVVVPFRNLSPRLDLRTDLVSKIRNPQGRRNAKVSRIILRAVIAPPKTLSCT